MIRVRGKRMTTASLKTHMDRRFKSQEQRSNEKFDAVEARFDRLAAQVDARFDSLSEKLDTVIRIAKLRYDHHDKLLHEDDERLKEP